MLLLHPRAISKPQTDLPSSHKLWRETGVALLPNRAKKVRRLPIAANSVGDGTNASRLTGCLPGRSIWQIARSKKYRTVPCPPRKADSLQTVMWRSPNAVQSVGAFSMETILWRDAVRGSQHPSTARLLVEFKHDFHDLFAVRLDVGVGFWVMAEGEVPRQEGAHGNPSLGKTTDGIHIVPALVH